MHLQHKLHTCRVLRWSWLHKLSTLNACFACVVLPVQGTTVASCRQTAEGNKAHPSSQWLDKLWDVVTSLHRESSRFSPNPDQILPQLLHGFLLIRLVGGHLASFNFCTSQHALTSQSLERLSADAPCRLAEVGCMCMTDSATCQEGTGSKLGDAVAEALQAEQPANRCSSAD